MNGLVRPPNNANPTSKTLLSTINRALLHPKRPSKSQYSQKRMSQQHFEIRQNQLSSKFAERKRRLILISKQNRNIYVKINSQKSKYNHQEMSKSYRSSRRIARRLERGRAISRGGSIDRLSMSSRGSRNRVSSLQMPRKQVTCQTLNIHKIDDKRVMDLRTVFSTDSRRNTPSANKENAHFEKYALPTLEHTGILTERNRFDFFHIKQEPEDYMVYKTAPAKRRRKATLIMP